VFPKTGIRVRVTATGGVLLALAGLAGVITAVVFYWDAVLNSMALAGFAVIGLCVGTVKGKS